MLFDILDVESEVIILTFTITLCSGKILEFNKSTIIRGAKALEPGIKLSDCMFYMQLVFEDSFDSRIAKDGSLIGTSDPYLGICGMLGTADFFQIDEDDKWYKTTAVESVSIRG